MALIVEHQKESLLHSGHNANPLHLLAFLCLTRSRLKLLWSLAMFKLFSKKKKLFFYEIYMYK